MVRLHRRGGCHSDGWLCDSTGRHAHTQNTPPASPAHVGQHCWVGQAARHLSHLSLHCILQGGAGHPNGKAFKRSGLWAQQHSRACVPACLPMPRRPTPNSGPPHPAPQAAQHRLSLLAGCRAVDAQAAGAGPGPSQPGTLAGGCAAANGQAAHCRCGTGPGGSHSAVIGTWIFTLCSPNRHHIPPMHVAPACLPVGLPARSARSGTPCLPPAPQQASCCGWRQNRRVAQQAQRPRGCELLSCTSRRSTSKGKSAVEAGASGGRAVAWRRRQVCRRLGRSCA